MPACKQPGEKAQEDIMGFLANAKRVLRQRARGVSLGFLRQYLGLPFIPAGVIQEMERRSAEFVMMRLGGLRMIYLREWCDRVYIGSLPEEEEEDEGDGEKSKGRKKKKKWAIIPRREHRIL